jgi:DNA repair protein RecO (recombination protein O)
MAGSLRTEAIVLRSIRYGEADRVLHLYTPGYGRLSAIAKGVRRSRSRFGARLEPFFQIHVILHQGRSDLHTVTSVDTVAAYPSLREHAATLDAAARACDAVARLFETPDPHPEVFRLLANELVLLDRDAGNACTANGLAFRLKLLLAAGIVPQLGSCAGCGESEHLQGFSPAAGGVVCNSCEAAAFPLGQEGHTFLVGALGRPLAEVPDASELALARAERAITETAEHHAHVRLRPLLSTGKGRVSPGSPGGRSSAGGFVSRAVRAAGRAGGARGPDEHPAGAPL